MQEKHGNRLADGWDVSPNQAPCRVTIDVCGLALYRWNSQFATSGRFWSIANLKRGVESAVKSSPSPPAAHAKRRSKLCEPPQMLQQSLGREKFKRSSTPPSSPPPFWSTRRKHPSNFPFQEARVRATLSYELENFWRCHYLESSLPPSPKHLVLFCHSKAPPASRRQLPLSPLSSVLHPLIFPALSNSWEKACMCPDPEKRLAMPLAHISLLPLANGRQVFFILRLPIPALGPVDPSQRCSNQQLLKGLDDFLQIPTSSIHFLCPPLPPHSTTQQEPYTHLSSEPP
ncbi:hypothetical protein CEXT_811071 [Caerostris extrusa]|uniref:Uncharacterized protein n=1 Tax=Caerostris extrusa TaxID=172846 RepID=A0AAV4T8L9_CAEEX|nr:hypothetical protein CEXT_811071 [Caerostris extrusa]